MKIWNVRLQVVDLVPAETAEEAIAKMSSRLYDDDYLPHTDEDPGDAFESETLDDEVTQSAIERYGPYR